MNIDRNPGKNAVVSKAETFLAQLSPDHRRHKQSYSTPKKPRSPGIWKGQVTMEKDFYDPLPPEILDSFLGAEE